MLTALLPHSLPPKNIKTKTSRTATLAVVLYGFETWYLSLIEEHRLRVLENRVPKEVFGPKGDEISGEWRKLHNKAIYHLYSGPNIIRVINRMG